MIFAQKIKAFLITTFSQLNRVPEFDTGTHKPNAYRLLIEGLMPVKILNLSKPLNS